MIRRGRDAATADGSGCRDRKLLDAVRETIAGGVVAAQREGRQQRGFEEIAVYDQVVAVVGRRAAEIQDIGLPVGRVEGYRVGPDVDGVYRAAVGNDVAGIEVRDGAAERRRELERV